MNPTPPPARPDRHHPLTTPVYLLLFCYSCSRLLCICSFLYFILFTPLTLWSPPVTAPYFCFFFLLSQCPHLFFLSAILPSSQHLPMDPFLHPHRSFSFMLSAFSWSVLSVTMLSTQLRGLALASLYLSSNTEGNMAVEGFECPP